MEWESDLRHHLWSATKRGFFFFGSKVAFGFFLWGTLLGNSNLQFEKKILVRIRISFGSSFHGTKRHVLALPLSAIFSAQRQKGGEDSFLSQEGAKPGEMPRISQSEAKTFSLIWSESRANFQICPGEQKKIIDVGKLQKSVSSYFSWDNSKVPPPWKGKSK